jgi:SAM-dependent methyltransferase
VYDLNDPKKYLYRNPISGVYTGYWSCSRPHGKYTGIWPIGLVERIFRVIGKPESILEPFGGISKLGVSIDWNRNVKPTILADAQHLPIREDSFDCVLLDPPYDNTSVQHYSDLDQRLKRTKPKFGFYKAYIEAARVCKPGGHVALLHTLIPKHIGRESFRRIATIGISTGPNKRIRCLSIYRKLQGKQTSFSTCS